jgi:hypothetical protein
LDPSFAAARLEFDRVAEQVACYLLQPVGIARNWIRQRVEHTLKSKSPRVCGWLKQIDSGIDHRRQVELLHIQPDFAERDPAHVEKVFDELRLRASIPLDNGESVAQSFFVLLPLQ